MAPDAELAFRRLLHIAQSDTGQARRVANFILAWWNAGDCGGFDLTDLWNVDAPIAADMAIVFSWLGNSGTHSYPDHHRAAIEDLVRIWRPHLTPASA
jgi:hypothetical protein